jgi:hypothetical protein
MDTALAEEPVGASDQVHLPVVRRLGDGCAIWLGHDRKV